MVTKNFGLVVTNLSFPTSGRGMENRDSFMFFELSYIPRDMNHLVDSLDVSVSLFFPPLPPRLSYDIQVKYRPSLPDNVKFWKVFDNDDELSKFLQLVDEFSDIHIDQENLNMEESKQLK